MAHHDSSSSGKPSGKKRQFQSLHGTIENFHGSAADLTPKPVILPRALIYPFFGFSLAAESLEARWQLALEASSSDVIRNLPIFMQRVTQRVIQVFALANVPQLLLRKAYG